MSIGFKKLEEPQFKMYQGKSSMWINVEHGCLVLAILNAISTGLVFLASVVCGIFIAAGVFFATPNHETVVATIFRGIAEFVFGIAVCVVGVATLIAFIFSVLLCDGICKRRPGQVKAYFIYGVTSTTIAVLAAVGYLISNYEDPAPGIYTLIASVIYSLFLVLVHQTYSKMQVEAVFKDHIQLVES